MPIHKIEVWLGKKSDRKSPEVLRTVRAEQRKPVKNRVAARLKARNNENTLTLLEISLSGMKKITMVFLSILTSNHRKPKHTQKASVKSVNMQICSRRATSEI